VVPSVPLRAQGQASAPSFKLSYAPDGSIVRFDPRYPIKVRVNARKARPGALDDVEEALKRVWGVSGLDFKLVGTTDEVPTKRSQERRVDPRHPEVVIAWCTPSGRGSSDLLGSGQMDVNGLRTAGVGGWYLQGVQHPGQPWRYGLTHGFVVIDSTQNEQHLPGFEPGGSRGAVLLHEVAHVLGLDHVDDPEELMFPLVTGKARYGRGDHEGLRRVGREAGPIW
jgi:hypothetical protein